MLSVGAFDVLGGESHHHAVRVAGGLDVDGVDDFKCGGGIEFFAGTWNNKNGEENGAEVPGAGPVEADEFGVVRIGRADVVIFVEHAKRSVGVSVDNDCG